MPQTLSKRQQIEKLLEIAEGNVAEVDRQIRILESSRVRYEGRVEAFKNALDILGNGEIKRAGDPIDVEDLNAKIADRANRQQGVRLHPADDAKE
jgi:hypothetical protein